MKCPKCDFENPADTLYCGKCGTELHFHGPIGTSGPTGKKPVRGPGPTDNKISVSHTKNFLKKMGLEK